MKYILTLGVMFATLTVFGQHMPDNKSFGLKASSNFSFPSFKSSTEATLSSSANTGFGAGFYFRYDFTERFSFQPELLFSTRTGSVNSETITETTTAISITETSLTNFSQVTVEFPLYFKMRWELTALRKGHYKANKAFGGVVGPRVLLNLTSKKETYSSEVTRLYNQESSVFVDGEKSGASDYFAPVSIGINVGVDFEVLNRLVLYANYFRGFTSMNRTELGFSSFDNRFELGVGLRLY